MNFSEDQIREVMKEHKPVNEGYCGCSWWIGGNTDQEFTTDHLLDELKRYVRRVD